MIEFSERIWSSAVVLLFVMDPLGNLPVVLSLLKDFDPRRRRLIIVRELFFALGILLLFLFLGQSILDFLALQQESVTIAGGIVLLVIGLRMVFPQRHGVMGDQPEGEPFLVPLAVPLIAGPSAMATLILMAHSHPDQTLNMLAALIIAWVGTAILLLLGQMLYRVLRMRGLLAVERLMGMLLIMIAVQMLLNGIAAVRG
jgi:multiple antibiotic resistance protein